MTLALVAGVDTPDGARRVHDFLVQSEAVNNLLARILGPALDDPAALGRMYVGAVQRDGQVVAAAVCNFIKLALASSSDLGAVEMLARDARAHLPGLPGVLGPAAEVEAFVNAWGPETPPRPGMLQRIYELGEMIPASPCPGAARLAAKADRPTVMRWWEAFMTEALPGQGHPDMVATMDSRLLGEQVLLWEIDGRPVSMAVGRPATPSGAVVGPVYTPPAERGHGFASAAVAELSRRLRSGSITSVFLYTDLANPTSNSIYQRIGYRPVCDVSEVWFREVPTQGWSPSTA